MVGLGDVLTVVLEEQCLPDPFDVDRHPTSVISAARPGREMLRGAAPIIGVGEREQPFGEIDPLELERDKRRGVAVD